VTRDERQAVVRQLVRHEGKRLKPYVDSVGKTTIGIGRNLTDKGISNAEAYLLLDHDLDECVADLGAFPWFHRLDPVRRRVLVDLRFNLGPSRFRGFTRMLRAVEGGRYQEAAAELQHSRWFTQVKTRGIRLVAMMQTGEDSRG
jgi:lysozyme